MFHVFTDKHLEHPQVNQVAADNGQATRDEGSTSSTNLRKAKLSVTGHSKEEIMLAPKLPFYSFIALRDAVERILSSLPESSVSLLSLQHRDTDGDLVDLIESTFDPQDFATPIKIYLRAKVRLVESPSKGNKTQKTGSSCTRGRRALGYRDPNSISRTPVTSKPEVPSSVHATLSKARGMKVRNRVQPPAPPVAETRGTPSIDLDRRRERERMVQSTPVGVRSISCDSPSTNESFCGKYRTRSPAAGTSLLSGGKSTGAPSLKGGKRKVDATRKPSWNDRVEPEWEEAERRRQAMRRDARARILRKREARAVAARVKHGKEPEKGGRVFRRAKRDCRVTDARRQRLALQIFHDPMGTLPSCLGKRDLSTFEALGRDAARLMKFLPVPTAEPASKRSRGGGEGIVAIPRSGGERREGSDTSMQNKILPPSAGALPVTAPQASKQTTATPAEAKGPDKQKSSSRPLPRVPKRPASRPSMSRPGDIGFGGRSVAGGAIMRPPVARSSTLAARRARAAANAKAANTAQAVPTVSTALTVAAATKLTSALDPPLWSGRLRTLSLGKFSPAVRAPTAPGRRKGESRAGQKDEKCLSSGRQRRTGRDKHGVVCGRTTVGCQDETSDAVTQAILAKLEKGGGGTVAGKAARKGQDVESLQEQVALLKAATGLSDEELTWRMETSKPGANAYRIASAALDRAEITYERLLWRQGQLEIARARLSGKGRGGDDATSNFALATARVAKCGDSPDSNALSRLKAAAESVMCSLETRTAKVPLSSRPIRSCRNPPGSSDGADFPAEAAAVKVRGAANRLVKLITAVETTVRTGSDIDGPAVAGEISTEAKALALRAAETDRELRAVRPEVEKAVEQVEAWQRRQTGAPEFSTEEAAKEDAWNTENMEANLAALHEQRALLPEAIWSMTASDIQAAAAAAEKRDPPGGDETPSDRPGVVYPAELCIRIRECRPLHWLVSAPEDIVSANFLTGEGAAAFTQLEGMDLTEMRAVWCVLPKEFSRDPDSKKAEWRARFRDQLQGLVRQQEQAVIAAGWDPVRGRRATCRLPPPPPHRLRHPAYFYPTPEELRERVARSREQHERLEGRKARLSALENEVAEAKSEVDSACEDARSDGLRARYGADTLRKAREAAKEAYTGLLRERKKLESLVAEGTRTLSATYPSLRQLEAEAQSVEGILRDLAPNGNATDPEEISKAEAEESSTCGDSNASPGTSGVRVSGAFSAEPRLLRRATATAKKLTPQEERLLRASEVQHVVSCRDGRGGAAESSADGDRPPGSAGNDVLPSVLCSAGAPQGAAEEREGCGRTMTTNGKGSEEAVDQGCGGRDQASAGCPGKGISKVKAAPGVLAFLNREFGARAAAAVSAAAPTERTEVGTRDQAGGDRRNPAAKHSSATINSCGGHSSLAHAPAPPTTKVPLPQRPPKPMSRSLAALVGASSGGESERGSSSKAQTRRIGFPALSFLGELKARAHEGGSGAGGSNSPSSPRKSDSKSVKENNRLPVVRGNPFGAAGPSSRLFLEELKARSASLR